VENKGTVHACVDLSLLKVTKSFFMRMQTQDYTELQSFFRIQENQKNKGKRERGKLIHSAAGIKSVVPYTVAEREPIERRDKLY
jgi:hypothetical protein